MMIFDNFFKSFEGLEKIIKNHHIIYKNKQNMIIGTII